MNAMQQAFESIETLSYNATWAEAEERIRFVAVIERGRDDINAGRLPPDAEICESLRDWLTPQLGIKNSCLAKCWPI